MGEPQPRGVSSATIGAYAAGLIVRAGLAAVTPAASAVTPPAYPLPTTVGSCAAHGVRRRP